MNTCERKQDIQAVTLYNKPVIQQADFWRGQNFGFEILCMKKWKKSLKIT